MSELMMSAGSWAPGVRLAVFFLTPALVVLRLLGVLTEVLLYGEFRLTTYLRQHRGGTAPSGLCEAVGLLAAARPSIRRASAILITLSVALAVMSIIARAAPANEFLTACQDIFEDWWATVMQRAGAA